MFVTPLVLSPIYALLWCVADTKTTSLQAHNMWSACSSQWHDILNHLTNAIQFTPYRNATGICDFQSTAVMPLEAGTIIALLLGQTDVQKNTNLSSNLNVPNLYSWNVLISWQVIWYTPARNSRPATGYLEERLRNVRKKLRSAQRGPGRVPPQPASEGVPVRTAVIPGHY